MSLDQYLSVKILMWRVVHFKRKQAYIVVSILCLLIMSLNINISHLVLVSPKYLTLASSAKY